MVQVIGPEGVDVTRVDPGSPALFRKNWERVVAGPHADALGEKSSVPGPVVDAAVWWMLSCGRERGSAGLDPTQGLLQRVRRPLLKAVVRWLPGGRSRPKKGREHRSRSKGLLTDGKGEGGLSRGRRGV